MQPSPSSTTRVIELSDQAAAFLLGTVRHLNEAKILPADNGQALQTSAWLEEIEAALHNPYPGVLEALRFYAHKGNYVPAGIAPTVWQDNGQRARAALRGTS